MCSLPLIRAHGEVAVGGATSHIQVFAMAVRVCEVEKSYGTSVVLDGLTMDVPYGSM